MTMGTTACTDQASLNKFVQPLCELEGVCMQPLVLGRIALPAPCKIIAVATLQTSAVVVEDEVGKKRREKMCYNSTVCQQKEQVDDAYPDMVESERISLAIVVDFLVELGEFLRHCGEQLGIGRYETLETEFERTEFDEACDCLPSL